MALATFMYFRSYVPSRTGSAAFLLVGFKSAPSTNLTGMPRIASKIYLAGTTARGTHQTSTGRAFDPMPLVPHRLCPSTSIPPNIIPSRRIPHGEALASYRKSSTTTRAYINLNSPGSPGSPPRLGTSLFFLLISPIHFDSSHNQGHVFSPGPLATSTPTTTTRSVRDSSPISHNRPSLEPAHYGPRDPDKDRCRSVRLFGRRCQ